MKLNFFVFSFCALFFLKSALGDVRYQVVGLDMFYPTGLQVENGIAHVVGSSFSSSEPLGEFMATWQTVGNNPVNIGTLPGGISSEANALNGTWAVGQSHYVDAHHNSFTRAFLYGPAGMQSLDNVSSYSSALDINSSGNIVGFADFGAGDVELPCLWNAVTGSMTRIGNVPRGGAMATNESNQVVGFMDTNDERKASIMHSLDGDMVRLDVPGSVSIANDINNVGAVVGFFLDDLGHRRAFVINADGQLELPDLLGGSSNTANSIDPHGNVVGQFTSAENSYRAYIWNSANGSTDLNDLIEPDSRWDLRGATVISDSGHIVGYGINPAGEFSAFLLVPVPSPGSGIILGFWAIYGITRFRQRQ